MSEDLKHPLKIRVRLFGAFRNFTESAEVECTLGTASTVTDLKRVLGQALLQMDLCPGSIPKNRAQEMESLLSASVLADERGILKNSERLSEGALLAILPPVCGG